MSKRATSREHLELSLRPCVGIMLINRDGLVWTGRRLPKWLGDKAGHIWQMPQGGIDRGETPRAAAMRELAEETGIVRARIVGEIPEWLSYDLPEALLGIALKGRYRGQRQKWFAMAFEGEDGEINIQPHKGKAEFDQWRWARAADLPGQIPAFKRRIYETVIAEFAHLVR